jgi:hypothetical protein
LSELIEGVPCAPGCQYLSVLFFIGCLRGRGQRWTTCAASITTATATATGATSCGLQRCARVLWRHSR